MLFDEIERNETRAKRQHEPTFAYLNSSARGLVAAVRQVLEQWFESYPEVEDKADLRSRFRSWTDAQHVSAFWELYLHELFSRTGFVLEPHPGIEGTSNHPDFLVKEAGEPSFYLEAIVAGLPSNVKAGADGRLSEILDLVNRMPASGWFLHVESSGACDTQPSARELRKFLEIWIASQDKNSTIATATSGDWDNLPKFEWQHEGLSLAFTLSPRSSEGASLTDTRLIGAIMNPGTLLHPEDEIRRAIKKKANKYGSLPLPLLVAVNVVSDVCEEIDIFNALFGSEAIVFDREPGGGSYGESFRRLPDGIWFDMQGPKNGSVSAVLIGSGIHHYTCGRKTPLLIHHPYPTHLLKTPTYPLPELKPDEQSRKMKRKDGAKASKFLRLPRPWPPDEID